MNKLSLFIFLLFFFTACTSQDKPIGKCVQDSDCNKAGCSSQICTTKENAPTIITTCEFKPEYECYQQTTCGCVQGKCNWKDQNFINACLTEKKS